MKETHTKSQLQEFRRKLVRAKQLSARMNYQNITMPLVDSGLTIPVVCDKTWHWFHSASLKKRKAIWQNSIADIDRRIKELK